MPGLGACESLSALEAWSLHLPLTLLKGRPEAGVLGACLPGEGSLDWGTCCGVLNVSLWEGLIILQL